MIATLALLLVASDHGSWRSLYAHGRDGNGPPNITFQLASRTDGKADYRVGVFEMDQGSGAVPITSKAFPDRVRFNRLSVHRNPVNDMWEEKGRFHKQFPRLLFAGRGQAQGRPVTYVWRLQETQTRTPVRLLRVFEGDARWPDQAEHGRKVRADILIERAEASWLPLADRPGWARGSTRLARIWTFNRDTERFTSGPWRRP